MRQYLIIWIVFFALPVCSQQSPTTDQVGYASRRTGWIGNCSAVVLPPITGSDGVQRWYVASAGHCAEGSGRVFAMEYPGRVSYPASEVFVDRLFRTWEPEVMILELSGVPHDGIPYATIDRRHPQDLEGSQSFTTAYPVRPVVNAASSSFPSTRMNYKAAAVSVFVTASGDHGLRFKSQIWGGNSGGPLWTMDEEPMLIGIASTTDTSQSTFSPVNHLLEAYASILTQVCPDGNCKPCPKCGKIHSNPLQGLLDQSRKDSIRDGGYKVVPDPELLKAIEELRSLRAELETIRSRLPEFVTQDQALEMLGELPDLDQFVKREDLKTFVEKSQLSNYASRDELAGGLGDLNASVQVAVDGLGALGTDHRSLRSDMENRISNIAGVVESLSSLREPSKWWERASTLWGGIGGVGATGAIGAWLLSRHRDKTRKQLIEVAGKGGADELDSMKSVVGKITDQIGDQMKLINRLHDVQSKYISQSQGVAGSGSHFQGSTAIEARETAAIPVDTNEAREYLALAEREGYSTLNDALYGRLAAEELDNIEGSSKATDEEKRVAKRFRRRLESRFNNLMPPVSVTSITRAVVRGDEDDGGYLD